MTDTRIHEAKVRRFYDADGEGAGIAYERLMGTIWHHGDPTAEAAGMSPVEAALILERDLMAVAGLGLGDRALDFGSGPGGATLNCARLTGATFVGVSNSDSLSQRARALAVEQGMVQQAVFLTIGDQDYRTLAAWPDSCFDAVTFFESVCHLPDKNMFFEAAFRLLKPGGRLVGMDWLQRPWGVCQTDEQIQRVIGPVCEHIRLAGLGTVDSYPVMMRTAGFEVTHAVDLFAEQLCWGSTPPEDRERWLTYDGPAGDVFQAGKRALDAARGAGVFTVGWFAATRPR
ncbi:MAG: methyltransferase domain-containing protein [Kutzneria sp.]|nr:methyltransferase domain-containing protein [Kutzneria sp.]